MYKLNINEVIKNVEGPDDTLSKRVVRGGFWIFSFRIVQKLFNLARLVILARILSPNDFGLMGIALLTMAILETFSQTGFQAALIQKKEDIKPYLDSAWTVLILRGFILFIILYFIAPYAAIFFNAPKAKLIIQIIGVSFLLGAFTNIGVIYFQKELEFNKEFIYQFAGTLADFIVAISAVLILRNVWALVFGLLAGNAARCFVSYLIHPYRPHFSSDLGKAKELFGFGKWVLGSNILIFLLIQGDDIIVGKLLGITALGFYQMAYRISNMPATEITHVISQVTFPAYSKLQDNLPKLREAYLKVLQFTAFLSFPIAGLIFVLAPDFTMIFLGEKWMPMVPAMQVLCIFGATRSINATFGSLYQAVGRPFLLTKVSFAQLCLLALIIYPFTVRGGIFGVSIAVTVANLFCLVLASYEALKILGESARILIRHLTIPALLSVSIMVSIHLVKILVGGRIILPVTFTLSIFVSLAVYLIFSKIAGFSLRSLMSVDKLSNGNPKKVDE